VINFISTKNEGLLYKEIYKIKNKEKLTGKLIETSIYEAPALALEVSIFGDKEIYLVSLENDGEVDFLNENVLETLKISPHLFVLYGSGAYFEKNISSLGEKVLKLEEKASFDFPSDMVSSLQRHDRKNSWAFLVRELNNKDAEPVHGSCVFAYKALTTYLIDPKKNSSESGVKDFSFKQAGQAAVLGKRKLDEVLDKYFELVLCYHNARNSEGDLKTQLEKWVLEN
jgi:hypothetical protein